MYLPTYCTTYIICNKYFWRVRQDHKMRWITIWKYFFLASLTVEDKDDESYLPLNVYRINRK